VSARAARGRAPHRGHLLAEFALAFPIFLLVFLGIAEGGYFVVASTIVSHATQEGARLGVLAGTSYGAVKNRVITNARPVVTVAPGDVTVCINDPSACGQSDYDGREAGDRLRVRTAYTHRPLVSYVFPALTWQANASTELMVEADAP
jgi:hypothetical protein